MERAERDAFVGGHQHRPYADDVFGDRAVVGVDNEEFFCEGIMPGITSVETDLEEIHEVRFRRLSPIGVYPCLLLSLTFASSSILI